MDLEKNPYSNHLNSMIMDLEKNPYSNYFYYINDKWILKKIPTAIIMLNKIVMDLEKNPHRNYYDKWLPQKNES